MADDWSGLIEQAKTILKCDSRGKYITDLDEKALDLVLYYKERAKNKNITNPFNYMWSSKQVIFKPWTRDIIENVDQQEVDERLPKSTLVWNFNDFQWSIPLVQLVVCTIDFDEEIEIRLKKIVKKRSIRCSQNVVSPKHSSMPIKDWIEWSLNKYDIRPLEQYYYWNWGFTSDKVDLKEYGIYVGNGPKEVIEL